MSEEDLEEIRQAALMREVSEEVRNEKLKEQWNKYKPYVFALICLALLGAVVFEGAKYWRNKVILQDSTDYISASSLASSEQTEAAIQKFEEIADRDKTGYAYLSLLRTVPLLEKQGKEKEAIDRLYEIKGNKSIPEPLRNAATIALSFRLMDTPDADMQQIADMIRPLSTGNSSWSVIAGDMLRLIQTKDTTTKGGVPAGTSMKGDKEGSVSKEERGKGDNVSKADKEGTNTSK